MSIYDISVRDAQDNEVSLANYQGKVLLIVNTATMCGFTPQYQGLQALYDQYHDQGLEILDFPCNQFAHQAPGNAQEIATFCTTRFGVTFPQFAKIEVNGDQQSPLYAYLKSQKGGLGGSAIKWNFTKFLVDRQGQVVARFGPTKTPEAMARDILPLLSQQ